VEVAFTAAGVLIALLALVVSVVVARRQTRIQERLAAIEEARRAEEVAARGRAWVTASLRRDQRDARGRDLRLVLRNEGPAFAGHVWFTAEKGPGVPEVQGTETLPLDLQPGQEVMFPVSPLLGSRAVLQVVVGWTDEDGELEHEERYTLHLM
jgi:hypothetical protein